jgi:hypothetical protein
MAVLDFQHLKYRLAWAFPDDPILGQSALSDCPPPMPCVVGVPRSGTTLLRRMLDAHPDVAIPAETGFLLSVISRPSSAGPLTGLELHRLLTSLQTWPSVGLDAQAYLDALTPLHPFAVSDGLRACFRLYADRFKKPRGGDSTPANLERMREISHILPEAHFIHVIRDGRDVALALRDASSVPDDDLSALGRSWSEQLRSARQLAARGLRYREIRYEELIADPEQTLRDVCAFLDLPFDRGVAALPPTAERAGRWRTELTSDEAAEIEAVAGDLLAELGYR